MQLENTNLYISNFTGSSLTEAEYVIHNFILPLQISISPEISMSFSLNSAQITPVYPTRGFTDTI